ncbi:MAG: PHB depolymerase family esterase [Gemmatimonadota bacterium]|nr:PHB depolymerase family esterase [Gemmatimonadota bacterium]
MVLGPLAQGKQPGIPRREFLACATASMAGVLGACRSSPTAPIDGPGRITARPSLPYLQPALGFSPLGLRNEFTNRDGLLYVPPSYQSDVPAPLLILLHGAGGKAQDWSTLVLAALADGLGAVILAPDSRSHFTWDIVESGNYDTDLPYLDLALRRTFDQCRIDPARVALGGFSDGGSAALSLGLANGDFTGSVMAFSPGFTDDGYLRGKPRVFVSHGSTDPVLSFESTRDVIVPFMRDRQLAVEWAPLVGGHFVPAGTMTRAFAWLGEGWGLGS